MASLIMSASAPLDRSVDSSSFGSLSRHVVPGVNLRYRAAAP